MATSQPSGTRRSSPTLGLFLALMGAASFLYYHQGLFMPRVVAVRTAEGLGNGYSFGNDFYQVWLSAQELMRHRRDPYSEEMTREIQTGLYGRPLDPKRPGDPIDRRVFPYPAYMDLLFWPATEFSFPVVRIFVTCLLGVLTAMGALFWLRALNWRPDWRWLAAIIVLTLCSYPALEGLFAGQLGLLVAFLLAAAILMLRRGRVLLAGILTALATIKPQVVALPLLFLLIWNWYDWHTRG
ncbi:MAG: glycosyltransferase family 87 protein, partial [Candidatus Sulfotelmatobacter sp.]